MKPSHLNILIGILALLIVIIPFVGKVFDKRYKWYKKIRPTGWVVILLFMCSIIISFLKDEKESSDDLKEKVLIDSVSNLRIEKSNAKIIRTFSDALAEYGLKYDSTEKIIKKMILDSSKHEVKILNGNEPEFYISEIKEIDSNQTKIIRTKSSVNHQAIYHLNLDYTILAEKDTGFVHMPRYKYSEDMTLSHSLVSTHNIEIDKTFTSRNLILVFKGNFEDNKGKKYQYKQIYVLDRILKIWGEPISPLKRRIVTYINKLNFEY